ncbi:MAG: acetyl-CoA C-acyltransferase [Betaproteobacteria bacterium]
MSALIIEALRSPRGRGNDKGALRSLKPVQLLASQFSALAQRTGLDTGLVEDVFVGCVTQTGEQGAHIGKLALIQAQWSDTTPALTLNRYCASGLTAVALAAEQALACDGLAVGAGVEMMSRVPMASDRGPLTHDPEFARQARLVPIGLAADAVATLEGFSRQQCDAYALSSQQRATNARAGGYFKSVVPVHLGEEGGLLLDETPRPQTTAEALAQIAPAFAGAGVDVIADLSRHCGLAGLNHVQHAGNSPAMDDGAAAVLVASPAAAKRLGLRARGRVLTVANASVDRTLALTGAVEASRRAMQRAGLQVADIDLFEVNESFAALMLHYMKHLGVAHQQLNVNGGAIALGHAMGATGAMLVGMALDELERRQQRRALIAICGAAGLAVAMVIERLEAP